MSLPPLDHKEDIEKYEALHEKKEIVFSGCKHPQITFDKDKHELRCICGVAFTGPRLHELERLLSRGD